MIRQGDANCFQVRESADRDRSVQQVARSNGELAYQVLSVKSSDVQVPLEQVILAVAGQLTQSIWPLTQAVKQT